MNRIHFLENLNPREINKIREIYRSYKKDGYKIDAIKKIRCEFPGTGLKESKDLIEACDELGIDRVLCRPNERFKSYRKINFANLEPPKLFEGCPICGREVPEDVVSVTTNSGERLGYFCRRCYEFLMMPDLLGQVKKRIDKVVDFADHLKTSNAEKI